MVGGADGDVVVVEPEVDLVAWFDAELVAQVFGDYHLAFGAHAVSHTTQYNLREVDGRHRLRKSVGHGHRLASKHHEEAPIGPARN